MSLRTGMFQDIRYAVRALFRSPRFAVTAIATLAVGTGVDVAVFTVTDAVLFRGLPRVHRSDRLAYITEGREGPGVSYPDYRDWKAQAKSFRDMALVRHTFTTLSAKGTSPESYEGAAVTTNTFKLLGVRPILGRDFGPSDEQPGAAPVAILSDSVWRHQFGTNTGIVGRSVEIDGVPTTVIGVMPSGFSFPHDTLWTPLIPTADLMKRGNRSGQFVVGRLASGATIRNASAEMRTIGHRLAAVYPNTNGGLIPLVRSPVDAATKTLYGMLWVAVDLVLLIACANVANLLLARAGGRVREIYVRSALGATRSRIARQLLFESVMISGLGGIVGWWLAEAALRLYIAVESVGDTQSFGHVMDYAMDYRVLAYAVAISIGSGLFAGMVPALRLSKTGPHGQLSDGGRGLAGARHGRRFAAALITMEVALATILLAGAGVLIRSFVNVYTADVGIATANLIVAPLNLPHRRYRTAQSQVSLYERLQSGLETLPGVDSVAFASAFPTEDTWKPAYQLANATPVSDRQKPSVGTLEVSPNYFRTLRVVLTAGRSFDTFDRASSLPVAIVNQRFVRRNWPGRNPLGRRLRLFDGKGPGPWLTVIGVVSNVVQSDHTRRALKPLVYVPYRQNPSSFTNILARTRVPPESLLAAFRSEIHKTDPALPLNVLPLNVWMSDKQGPYIVRRMMAGLLFVFATVALLLAAVGLYAIVSDAVSRRTREIGVRTAMGAVARDIRVMVLRQGMLPVGAGLGMGVIASFAVNRVFEAQLVGVSPTDPLALMCASTVLVLTAVLGCLLPARRAARVDPVVALRHE